MCWTAPSNNGSMRKLLTLKHLFMSPSCHRQTDAYGFTSSASSREAAAESLEKL